MNYKQNKDQSHFDIKDFFEKNLKLKNNETKALGC